MKTGKSKPVQPRRKVAALSVLGALVLSLTGCGTSEPVRHGGGHYKVGTPYEIAGVRYYPEEDWNYDRTGTASWYGDEFHGRRTANGETFDMNGLTAAHPTLPMPTRIKVTNLDNGRSLVLRLNDRGPFKRGRILDVSKRAAKDLGFYAQGTARVRVQMLGRARIAQVNPMSPVDRSELAAAGRTSTLTTLQARLDEIAREGVGPDGDPTLGAPVIAQSLPAQPTQAAPLRTAPAAVSPLRTPPPTAPTAIERQRIASVPEQPVRPAPVQTPPLPQDPVPASIDRKEPLASDKIRDFFGRAAASVRSTVSSVFGGAEEERVSTQQIPDERPGSQPVGTEPEQAERVRDLVYQATTLDSTRVSGPRTPEPVAVAMPVIHERRSPTPAIDSVRADLLGRPVSPQPVAPFEQERETVAAAPQTLPPQPRQPLPPMSMVPLTPSSGSSAQAEIPRAPAPVTLAPARETPARFPAPAPALNVRQADAIVSDLTEAPDSPRVWRAAEPEPGQPLRKAPVILQEGPLVLADGTIANANVTPVAPIVPTDAISRAPAPRQSQQTPPPASQPVRKPVPAAPAPMVRPSVAPVPRSFVTPDPAPQPAPVIERAPAALDRIALAPEPMRPQPLVTDILFVEIDAFRLERNVQELMAEITRGPLGPQPFDVKIDDGSRRPLHHVRIGPYGSQREANDIAQRLIQLGYVESKIVPE